MESIKERDSKTRMLEPILSPSEVVAYSLGGLIILVGFIVIYVRYFWR